MIASHPSARLACVTVLKVARIANDAMVDAQGRNLHVKGLAELAHWSRALGLPPERVTHHVLEAPDPAAAIVDYARANQVDHVLLGARASSTLRRYLGSVSSQVVASAPCSVTVVRVPGQASAATAESEAVATALSRKLQAQEAASREVQRLRQESDELRE